MIYRVNQDGTVSVPTCDTVMCQNQIFADNGGNDFHAISKSRLATLFDD